MLDRINDINWEMLGQMNEIVVPTWLVVILVILAVKGLIK